ncbi:MAG: hypothetical protein J0J04_08145 [Microbacterium sp.]|uniref:hypothetical protein n=1 Tax=Microbacterium sp. TaxID=51671 RepID=UPI001AC784F5|nr:hypothetical protein [Microbacterium sp.]MBN9214771.1 hypothetical protein [Microbacterium sp.]
MRSRSPFLDEMATNRRRYRAKVAVAAVVTSMVVAAAVFAVLHAIGIYTEDAGDVPAIFTVLTAMLLGIGSGSTAAAFVGRKGYPLPTL